MTREEWLEGRVLEATAHFEWVLKWEADKDKCGLSKEMHKANFLLSFWERHLDAEREAV